MSWFGRYSRSSIGAKHIMAVTGLLMLLFAIVHMVGHLQMFGGPEVYNKYAHFLQSLWEVKWPTRIGLLLILLTHAALAIGLVAKNRAARPVGYAMYKPKASTVAGRTMAYTGLVVFAFLAFHILHFTAGQIQPQYFHQQVNGVYDAYGMYVHGFQQPAIYGIYLGGVFLLCTHLSHGAASWAQSLGWRHPKYPLDKLGTLLGWGLFIGYMIPPTAVLLGVIK
ncbi:hypothetical protein BH11MYX2_BH11MYX2_18700 [soil metagenome]